MTPVSIIPTPIINRDFPIIVVYAFLSESFTFLWWYSCIYEFFSFFHISQPKQKNKMPTMSKKNNSNHRIKSPLQKEISH